MNSHQPNLPQQPKFSDDRFFDASPSEVADWDCEVLLLTATDVELRTALKSLRPAHGHSHIVRTRSGGHTYYCGIAGSHRVVLTKCRAGYALPGASLLASLNALEQWRPKALIMVGIAFGKDPKKQQIGDVLVSSQIICYGLQRRGGTTIYRGPQPEADPVLLSIFENAIDWNFKLPNKKLSSKRIGPILSGEVLIDDKGFKDELFAQFPQAIGGEMEAVGVYTASQHLGVPWIIVKGIADWAEGKSDKHQALAAQTAVSLVNYVLGKPLGLEEWGKYAIPPHNHRNTVAKLRPVLARRLTRADVAVIWFDLFQSSLEDDMPGSPFDGCLIQLLVLAEKRNLEKVLLRILAEVCPWALAAEPEVEPLLRQYILV